MSFEDEIAELVKKAQEETRQEEQHARDLEARWDDVRRSLVGQILQEAANALQKSIGGRVTYRNESAVDLGAVWTSEASIFMHTLSFSGTRNAYG